MLQTEYFLGKLGFATAENEPSKIWGNSANLRGTAREVDGLLTADPRIIPGAQPVPAVSFEEANELAFFGAKARPRAC